MMTLAYYCQHSGFFSQATWKTYLCWISHNNKNSDELSLHAA